MNSSGNAGGTVNPEGQPSATATAPTAATNAEPSPPVMNSATQPVAPSSSPAAPPRKKKIKKRNKDASGKDDPVRKKTKRRNNNAGSVNPDLPGLSAAQMAVNEQMRRALEEDQYSALGSILDTDSETEDDTHAYSYRGQPVRLDRSALLTAVRKHNLLERLGALGRTVLPPDDEEDDEEDSSDKRKAGGDGKKGSEANKGSERGSEIGKATGPSGDALALKEGVDPLGFDLAHEDDMERDGGSIFGQTTGTSNSTWVECDKCKKWRRLRGVVDEKKLPTKWFCSMNKNDPERARCSAPEEEYEASHTPESAADARTRKHLRVWVRRLQCNESYESRQPTLTRGKKRAAASSSKDPYEWVRCCNPSCGKWRAILRIMDAKNNVLDRTTEGEWYCVMNTWDEKIASCAAPQENLPAMGCPLGSCRMNKD